MELVNGTGMIAGYTLGKDPDARERIVVAVKGTFELPKTDVEPTLAAKQTLLVMADEFTGEPGLSAMLYESDFAPVKQRCDVLLNGSAHAPGGAPVERITVGVRIGSMAKSFEVIGDRAWDSSLLSMVPSRPRSFITKPFSYNTAYGGMDKAPDNPDKTDACLANPVGIGHYPLTPRKALVGKPLPNTHVVGEEVTAVKGKYAPMAFGPIGRNFQSRVPLAGTYDQNWLDNVFPMLPRDFNSLYYQCAPPDQQIDFPKGGERVELVNLTPGGPGRTVFKLPTIEVPVEFTNASYERTQMLAVLDTIVIEPDLNRIMLTWRASIQLRRNIFEIKQAVVGRMSRGWYRARDLSKTYYPSLKSLIESRAAEREEASA